MHRKDGGSEEVFERRHVSFFGVTAPVTVDMWVGLQLDKDNPDLKNIQPAHLLWGMMFLKLCSSESELSALAGAVDEKTHRRWAKLVIAKISFTAPEVVSP